MDRHGHDQPRLFSPKRSRRGQPGAEQPAEQRRQSDPPPVLEGDDEAPGGGIVQRRCDDAVVGGRLRQAWRAACAGRNRAGKGTSAPGAARLARDGQCGPAPGAEPALPRHSRATQRTARRENKIDDRCDPIRDLHHQGVRRIGATRKPLAAAGGRRLAQRHGLVRFPAPAPNALAPSGDLCPPPSPGWLAAHDGAPGPPRSCPLPV